jgi:hypothetical protein
MRHVLSRLLLVVCTLALGGMACAADDTSMYEGSTLVNSQNTAERATALPNALAQVLVKISGQRNAAQLARSQLGIASKIAQDVRYTAESETINGAPIYRQKMTAHFPRDAVDALLASAGLPVWPSPRPPIVLWLVIDDGHGARMVGTAHVNAVKSLTDRASERGLNVVLPAASPAENLAAALALAQPQAVVGPSAAYGSPVQLVGKLARTASGWSAQWVLLDGGAELNRWSETNPDARLAMANGVDVAADSLGKKYARMIAGGPAGTFTVEIDGLRTSDDYVRAIGYLEGIGIVRKIVLLGVSDGRLRMQLDLSTGIEGFRNVLAASQVLELETDGASPVFRLRP